MKVLFYLNEFSQKGGIERVWCDRFAFLAELANIEITLLVYGKANIERCGGGYPYPVPNTVRVIFLNHNDNVKPRNMFVSLARLIRKNVEISSYIKNHHFDIIFARLDHCQYFILSLFTKKKIIFESHFSIEKKIEESRFIFRRVKWMLTRTCVALSKRTICLTSEDASVIKNANNVEVIPNYTNIVKEADPNYLTKEIIFIGRLERQKRADLLIEAWRLIAKKYTDWKINIFGEGSQYSLIVSLIEKYNLQKSIILHGNVDNISHHMANSSFLISTSEFEGQPLCILEAITCALPCVAFNCKCGVSEMVDHMVNGYLVEPLNVQQMAKAISWMIDNPDKRSLMGMNAEKKSKQFDKQVILNMWSKLLNDISSLQSKKRVQ